MSELISRFRSEFLRTKKSLGQHFLTNHHFITEIADAAHILKDTPVLEIGPGCGVLTEELAKRTDRITVVELDSNATEFLEKNKIEFFPHLNIIHDDVLNVNLSELYNEPFVVVSNLPYNVSVKIYEHCTNNIKNIKKLVFMFQKEVAARITATRGNKEYSSLSVYTGYHYTTRKVRDIGGGNFWPNANVTSTVVEFTPKAIFPLSEEESDHFLKFMRTAFSRKRKTLRNNLTEVKNLAEILSETGLSASVRAEELSLEDFLKIYERASF